MVKKKDRVRFEAGQRPWRDVSVFAGGPGQRWTLWASVTAVVLMVGVSVLVLLPKPSPAGELAGSVLAPAAGAASGELCEQAPVGSSQMPPADLAWRSVHGSSWPVSDTVGPKQQLDGVGQCFDRSPIGAALAAVGSVQGARTADADVLGRIFATRFVQNAGLQITKDQFEKLLVTQPVTNRPWGRSVGFKIVSFSPDVAHVLLVEQWAGAGQFLGWDVTVAWSGQDWLVRVNDQGQLSANGSITVDPTGFTRWEALP